MDTAGPGFFEVCGLTVGVLVALVAFLQGVLWLVERLGWLVGRIASGGIVHTQSDAEAAYTEAAASESRWLAGEGDQDDEHEQTWEYETDPRTGRVTVLPPACDADADEGDEGDEGEEGEEDKAASAAFLQGLPPDFLVELDGGLVVTAAEAATWADLRACYQGAAS